MQGCLRLSLYSLILSSIISTSYAATTDAQTSQHPSSWHLGVVNGLSIIDTHEPGATDKNARTSSAQAYSFTNRSYTAAFYLGYDWAITPKVNLGWEGGYQDLGDSTLLFNYGAVSSSSKEQIQDKVHAYNLLLTSKYWLSNQFDIFSKVGFAYEQLQRQNSCQTGNCNALLPGGSTQETRYYLNPEFQVGAGWQFSRHWNLNLVYERIVGDKNTTYDYNVSANPYYVYDTRLNPTISSILLGIDYQFSTAPAAAINLSKLHPNGWYVGLFNGIDVINTTEQGPGDDSASAGSNIRYTLSNRNYTGGFYAGYDWALTNRWSVGAEGGYQNLGNTNWTENSIDESYFLTASDKIYALNALLTAKYWMSNQFNLFTKLGIAYEQVTRTASCAGSGCTEYFPTLKNSPSQINYYLAPEVQMGFGWQVANHWNVNLAYQQIFGDGMSTEYGFAENQNSATNPTIQSILLGVDYQFANSPSPTTLMMRHPGGWHVGAVNGLSVINTHEIQETNAPYDSNSAAYTADNRSYTAGLYAGYDWALSNDWNIGVETGYQDFGKVNSAIIDSVDSYQINNADKIKAVDLLFTAKYWLSNRVDLFGKFGAAYEWLTRDTSCQGSCAANTFLPGDISETRYSINPEMQTGLGWQFSDHWNMNVAYQHVFTYKSEQYNNLAGASSGHAWYDWHTNPSIDSILIGMDYQFSDGPTLAAIAKAHPGGWHVGTTAGISVINSNESGPSQDFTDETFGYSNRSAAAGVYTGYDWALNDSWLLGAEVGYQSLGSTEWSESQVGQDYSVKADTNVHAIDFLFTTKYWLTNQVDLFSKLGVAYEQVHTKLTCELGGTCNGYLPNSSYTEENRYSLNPELQMGLGWEFADNWNLSVAYRKVASSLVRVYNYQDSPNSEVNPDINSFLIGLDYQFSQMPMSSTLPTNHTTGWHAGMVNGMSDIETDEAGGSQNEDGYTYNLRNQSYAAGFDLGYDWSLTESWAIGLETGYQYLGRSKWTYDNTLSPSTTAHVSAITTIQALDTLLTAKYWISNQVDMFGKLGAAYELQNRKVTCDGVDCGTSSDSNYIPVGATSENRYYLNPELQLGLGWQAANNWNINFAYQEIYSSSTTTANPAMQHYFDRHNNPSISSLLVGLDYKF